MNFRKTLTSDCLQTLYIYVFWSADYEYNSENTSKFYVHGENYENPIKVMVSHFHYENHCKFQKDFQTKVVDLIKIHILRSIHFFRANDSF